MNQGPQGPFFLPGPTNDLNSPMYNLVNRAYNGLLRYKYRVAKEQRL